MGLLFVVVHTCAILVIIWWSQQAPPTEERWYRRTKWSALLDPWILPVYGWLKLDDPLHLAVTCLISGGIIYGLVGFGVGRVIRWAMDERMRMESATGKKAGIFDSRLMQRRIMTCVASLACLPPVVGVALLVLLAIRARLLIGDWPSYGAPDPQALPFWYHRKLTNAMLAWSLVVTPILSIGQTILALGWRHITWRMWLPWVVYACFMACSYSDPGSLFEWLGD